MDSRTEGEMSALKTQALSDESQRNEHNRNEKLRNVIACEVWDLKAAKGCLTKTSKLLAQFSLAEQYPHF